MNIDNLTYGELKQIAKMFNNAENKSIDNHMIGKYVVVRCRDAGVHSGILESHNGRECVLTESRRLWYWKATKGAFLSAVATAGITNESKIGREIPRIHLLEGCEIIECTKEAEKSIRSKSDYNE